MFDATEVLLEAVKNSLHRRPADHVEPEGDLLPADRYVLASLLQKAIRRGHLAMARRAAAQLLKADRQRLWRRLQVIAFEDIGSREPLAMATLIGVATQPIIRKMFESPLHAIDHALRLACAAVKDRAPDHVHSFAERIPDAATDGQLGAALDAHLMEILSCPSESLVARAKAAAAFHQRISHVSGAARRIAMSRLMERFAISGAPEVLLASCVAYRERDPLPVYALLAWTLYSHDALPVRHSEPVSELIEGIPDYAFDPHHTRIGKRAVRLWHRSYLSSPAWSPRQIAMALWNSEAAFCDQTWKGPFESDLQTRAYRTDLLSCGVAGERQQELYDWIAQEREALACARRAAFRATP